MGKPKVSTDTPDEELLTLLRKGSDLAFQVIYQKYAVKLYAVTYSRLRSKEITEEIVQDIFVSLWENRGKLSVHNLSSYLYAAAKHDVLDHLKFQKIRDKYALGVRNLGEPVENTTERQLSFHELYEITQREVNKLPEKCQLIFKLSREGSFSSKEIADQLNISPKTVDNQINKAIGILRLQLDDHLTSFLLCLVLWQHFLD